MCARGGRARPAGPPPPPHAGNNGRDAGVEQADEAFDNFGAHGGEAAGERGGEQEHHRADGLARQGGSDARGVAADEVSLEIAEIGIGDPLTRKRTKPRVNAVMRFTVAHRLEKGVAAGGEAACALGVELDPGVCASDGRHLIECQRRAVESDFMCVFVG